VRELLQRTTAIAALLTAACVAWINLTTETPWPLALARAAAALGIVIAAGFVIGSILMRTALRRHYETWLSQSRRGRAGVER
jgi:uncharacterized SAM-binding protein YcdF (DUF218 family)